MIGRPFSANYNMGICFGKTNVIMTYVPIELAEANPYELMCNGNF